MAFDPNQFAGAGTENLDESSSMPLLSILQALSPELKKKDEKYIDGASQGDIVHKGLGEIIPQPLTVIPISVKTMYVEWVPKDLGGGLVGMHGPEIVNSPLYEQGRKGKPSNTKTYDEWLGENELRYTAYWLFKALIKGEWVETMIAMSSTQLRVHRKLNQDIKKFRYDGLDVVPPVFARSWELSAVEETNKNNQDYFNFQFSNPQVLDFKKDEEVLDICGALYKESALFLPQEPKPAAPALEAGEAVDAEVVTESEPF
jgi:hypothetical protein